MEIDQIVKRQKAYFKTGSTRPLAFRLAALRRLSQAIARNESEILQALAQDLGKSDIEGYFTEIGIIQEDLRHTMQHLCWWTQTKIAPVSLMQLPAIGKIKPEPYGVVLIMSPWNYPLLLTLEPLISAIAAGNCAVIKPSAYSPSTSQVIGRIVAECFSPDYCAVVQGGRAENARLLDQRFDYIFFTGGTAVGRLVMEKAAAHLTPITLELGGKSPAIVDRTADISLAARRLVFGKFINAGQTCVAPDYVLVHKDVYQQLVRQLAYWISRFYPADLSTGLIKDYPHIVNEKHFDRLLGLFEGVTTAVGGKTSREHLFMEPSVLTDVSFDSPVMQQEIFGPLLPLIPYHSLDQAIGWITQREKPLALYVFSRSKAVQRRVLDRVSFGGGCVNDVLMHLATPHLPFGGVGESGMGSYHGKAGFDTFTHYKSILHKGTMLDPSVRYRPYTPFKKQVIRLLLPQGK